MGWLNALADFATITTAVVAVVAYGSYRVTNRRRTKQLEEVLAKKNQPNDDSLALKQLAIELTLTEQQVIEAASRSKMIEPWIGTSGNEYRFRMKKHHQLSR